MPGAQQGVQVVGEQGPGEDAGLSFPATGGQAREQIAFVVVGAAESTALDAARHDVMQGAGGIQARRPGHVH